MGAVSSVVGWFERVFSRKKATILMVGLDAAGKTTILVKLKLDAVEPTVPTVGFNVETVEFHNVTFHLWDIGGQKRLRGLWRHYYDGAHAIIFVIDSNDRARLPDAREELLGLLRDPALTEASLLILCNKQDLPERLNPEEIARRLGIDPHSGPQVTGDGVGRHLVGRRWYIQGCCAHTGQGLFEGLDWLCEHLPEDI
ncbi:unnamed protein product [Phytomonas sp. Hart1]|nr:unnamed protein product [Phytomonas sp. Hart1]|eukprot:CCW71196.1 unnamed protein product [Phytomonas sp. isolate Hart1]